MARFIYIALFTLLGFFIMTPTDIYAYGSKSENIESTCNKESDTEKEKKDCCDPAKGQYGKHGKDCDGKCGNPACHCPTSNTNFIVSFFREFSRIKVTVEKSNFYYQDAYYSSGFLSIWLPPKIG